MLSRIAKETNTKISLRVDLTNQEIDTMADVVADQYVLDAAAALLSSVGYSFPTDVAITPDEFLGAFSYLETQPLPIRNLDVDTSEAYLDDLFNVDRKAYRVVLIGAMALLMGRQLYDHYDVWLESYNNLQLAAVELDLVDSVPAMDQIRRSINNGMTWRFLADEDGRPASERFRADLIARAEALLASDVIRELLTAHPHQAMIDTLVQTPETAIYQVDEFSQPISPERVEQALQVIAQDPLIFKTFFMGGDSLEELLNKISTQLGGKAYVNRNDFYNKHKKSDNKLD